MWLQKLMLLKMMDEYEEHSLKEALQYNSTEKRRHSNNSNSCIFSLTVELFSNIDAKFQTCIRLVSGPLELVYSPMCFGRVTQVFKYPSDLGRRLENVVADLNSLTSLEARAKAKLEFAMSSHARVDIDMRARAPVIIIPSRSNT